MDKGSHKPTNEERERVLDLLSEQLTEIAGVDISLKSGIFFATMKNEDGSLRDSGAFFPLLTKDKEGDALGYSPELVKFLEIIAKALSEESARPFRAIFELALKASKEIRPIDFQDLALIQEVGKEVESFAFSHSINKMINENGSKNESN